MSDYLGKYELRPLNDGHKSFYGKAFVERYAVDGGTQYVLRSYNTIVAAVTPDADTKVLEVRVGMEYLSATTLRHVKEFLAQTDNAFKGITLGRIRKAIKGGRPIDGTRKAYVLKEL